LLRLTKPRLDVLRVLHHVGGRVHRPDGRATAQVAEALGYSGSLTSLKRVLVALEANGLVATETKAGRVHDLTLTAAGQQILRDHGLVEDAPRYQLLPDELCQDRQLLVFACATIGQRLEDWARQADMSKPVDDLRFEAALAIHHDITPRVPHDDELAVLIARARVALGNLLDSFLTDRADVDARLVETALRAVLDARVTLVAWHKAASGAPNVDVSEESVVG
jgi:hypothetical protein